MQFGQVRLAVLTAQPPRKK